MKILVRSLNGKVRVFYSNNKSKGCWYGFVGRPVIRFSLDPVLGKDNKFQIKYIPKLRQLIEDIFSKRIDKYTLPNKRPLSIPLTKSSKQEYQKKQKQSDTKKLDSSPSSPTQRRNLYRKRKESKSFFIQTEKSIKKR